MDTVSAPFGSALRLDGEHQDLRVRDRSGVVAGGGDSMGRDQIVATRGDGLCHHHGGGLGDAAPEEAPEEGVGHVAAAQERDSSRHGEGHTTRREKWGVARGEALGLDPNCAKLGR
jgi:hypothetical protein